MVAISLLIGLSIAAGQKPAAGPDVSILGVRIGMKLADVRKVLDPLGESGGVKTRDGGDKIAWSLREGDLKSVALRTAKDGTVKWVTGFYRPGREVPFSTFQHLGAGQVSPNEGIWTVQGGAAPYRVVAKGSARKASVVYLLKL